MIQFKCSKCGEELEAPESLKNERLQCPKCRYPEVIPDDDQAKASIAIESDGDAADRPADAAAGRQCKKMSQTRFGSWVWDDLAL